MLFVSFRSVLFLLLLLLLHCRVMCVVFVFVVLLFCFCFLLFDSLFGFPFFVVVDFVLCSLYRVFSHGTLWCSSCLDAWFTPSSPRPSLLLVLTIPLHSPSQAPIHAHTRTHARTHARKHTRTHTQRERERERERDVQTHLSYITHRVTQIQT